MKKARCTSLSLLLLESVVAADEVVVWVAWEEVWVAREETRVGSVATVGCQCLISGNEKMVTGMRSADPCALNCSVVIYACCAGLFHTPAHGDAADELWCCIGYIG